MKESKFWVSNPSRKKDGTYETLVASHDGETRFITPDGETALELHDWLASHMTADVVTGSPTEVLKARTATSPAFDAILWNYMSPTKRELVLREDNAVITFNLTCLDGSGDDKYYVGTCSMKDDASDNYIYAKPRNLDTEEECVQWIKDTLEAIDTLFGIEFNLLTYTL